MKKYTENSETHTEDLTMYHYGMINEKKKYQVVPLDIGVSEMC